VELVGAVGHHRTDVGRRRHHKRVARVCDGTVVSCIWFVGTCAHRACHTGVDARVGTGLSTTGTTCECVGVATCADGALVRAAHFTACMVRWLLLRRAPPFTTSYKWCYPRICPRCSAIISSRPGASTCRHKCMCLCRNVVGWHVGTPCRRLTRR
jgi:hypothetical protein